MSTISAVGELYYNSTGSRGSYTSNLYRTLYRDGEILRSIALAENLLSILGVLYYVCLLGKSICFPQKMVLFFDTMKRFPW